ncbi:carbonic anhydrase [Neobacillus citreus]|uniref:Carbonic anhydrase n=1 Tax=Neobacillus citreus TaxID=2833578 RepID=A0A942T0P7_9BACI|nr:carbonic anhydrase [Neobacillus citreus]MCH6265012.1 carbonic anhydrase [Neobacillus citreus]
MNMNEKKKVLFVIGMEQSPEIIIEKMSSLEPNNILVLQSYGPAIAPFSDLMRDIILAVYRENVEEIFVTVPTANRKNARETLKKIYDNKELQEKIKTLDYLFKNSMPEHPKGSIREWLEGNESSSSANSIQNNADVIRNHPLMPSNVKVTELIIETKNLAKVMHRDGSLASNY